MPTASILSRRTDYYHRVPRWVAPSVAVLACSWLVLIVAAPFLWVPAAGVMYAAGSFICHQIPQRSFHLDGIQLPVCARCLGLYGGGTFGSVIAAFRRWSTNDGHVLTRVARWKWTAIAAIPTIATFVLEWGFGWPISNTVRAVAALPVGAAVAFVVVISAATVHYE